MPFERPTLQQLVDRNRAAIEANLDGVDPRIRRSATGAIAAANAGAHHEMFGFLEWIARQGFPDTVEDAELERQVEPWGIVRVPATRATGSLEITGTNGTAIPAGTKWKRGDGSEVESLVEVRIVAGTAIINIRSVDPGANANAEVNTAYILISPIRGVVSRARANVAIAGGADIESDSSLRSRWIARRREPPRGGTVVDYQLWSRAAHPAVTRAWARPLARGLGTVDVYLMTDGATANGVPPNNIISAVSDYLDDRRPVTADVDVFAPVPVDLDVVISTLSPDTAAIRAAITAEIADLILRESEPGGTILISQLREAISTAEGETDHALMSPTANVVVSASQISVLGDVTFPGS